MSEYGSVTPEDVRLWAIVLIGVLLAVGGFIARQPTTLMLGTTLLGTEPLARARNEPPPQEPTKEAVPA